MAMRGWGKRERHMPQERQTNNKNAQGYSSPASSSPSSSSAGRITYSRELKPVSYVVGEKRREEKMDMRLAQRMKREEKKKRV
jgi:hypothetical protein